jgi:ribosome-associated protein
MRDVPIDGDMIRLGQFLKLADLIDTGGEAKWRIGAGEVSVNGQVEDRRGRRLVPGDVVTLGDASVRVA